MKKITLGCLAAIGGLVVVSVIIAIVFGYLNGDTPDGTTPDTEDTTTSIDLIEAQSRGLVETSATGVGNIERIMVTVTSKSNETLEITILPGTIFAAQSVSVQSMVVTAEKIFSLDPNQTRGPIGINAACANMSLDMPSASDALALQTPPASEDLVKLLILPQFHQENFYVQQFAIWTITDNPARYEYVGIGSSGYSGGPTDDELAIIRSLFIQAGIDPDKYQALS